MSTPEPIRNRAGSFAYVEKYTKFNGEPGYVIHCQLCPAQERRWSSRVAAKRILGRKREAAHYHTWRDVMDLWTLHMQLHHRYQDPPKWRVSDDLDAGVADAESRFFEPRELTAEEKLLREIFGSP